MKKPYLVSVICLVYNNEDQFKETFQSILRATSNLENLIEIIVIDSSTLSIAHANKQFMLSCSSPKYSVRHVTSQPKGIYPAMNLSLSLAKGLYLNFMNSGDIYHRCFHFSNVLPIIQDLISFSTSFNSLPTLLYGRTLVQSCISSLEYLNPPRNVAPHRRTLWNKVIPPGHQSCLFLRSWHLDNPYLVDKGSAADRFVILSSISNSVFLDIIVADFRLSGLTSLNNLKPSQYFSYFIQLRALIPILGFWPKVFFKHILRSRWEYLRLLRLQILSFLLF